MLSLSARYIIDLRASRLKSAGVLAPDAKQYEFGHVPEIEADSATVGTSVLSNLVPNYVAFVPKALCLIASMPSGGTSVLILLENLPIVELKRGGRNGEDQSSSAEIS